MSTSEDGRLIQILNPANWAKTLMEPISFIFETCAKKVEQLNVTEEDIEESKIQLKML